MDFNQNLDEFNNQFEIWLREITQMLKEEEMTKQFPIQERRNRLLSYIPNNRPQQGIQLQDFIQQVSMALRDEFMGDITREENNCLCIKFSNNDIFRVQITKCGGWQ